MPSKSTPKQSAGRGHGTRKGIKTTTLAGT